MNDIEIIVNGIRLNTYATATEISKILDILDCEHSDEYQDGDQIMNVPGLSEMYFETVRQAIEASFKD